MEFYFMDYKKALQILEIDINEFHGELSIVNIKKQYHKLALLNHPDKNDGTPESSQKFLEIKSAYEFLIKEVSNNTHKCDSLEQDDFMENAPAKYFRMTVGAEVRLKYAYIVKCTNFIKDTVDLIINRIRCRL
jgi:hypothetical protein